jgi:tyrosinase
MLDLERELQRIDPSVALPYWRFDRPAPKLFTRAFIGAPADATGFALFNPTNPLRLWMTDGVPGIMRDPDFDVATSGAFVSAEAVTVNSNVSYAQLRPVFEGNPHGAAHVSFSGWISSVPTAAKDPLFFLLHCNVDRLWAKWQWFQRRFDATKTTHYTFTGSSTSAGAARIGHNALDTMWPWNGVTVSPRPSTAPRKPFPSTLTATAPAAKPTVGVMLDFQGRGDPGRRLGMDYDDVPYEPDF